MAAITEAMWNATPDNTRSYWLNSDFDGGGKAGGAGSEGHFVYTGGTAGLAAGYGIGSTLDFAGNFNSQYGHVTNGVLHYTYWTNGTPGSGNSIQGLVGYSMKLAQNAWKGNLPHNEFVDNIINNKYYNLASLGLDQSVAKSSSYIAKALETKSSVNFTVLNKYAKPAFRTNLAGSMTQTSKVVTVSKVLKGVGTTLAVVGVGVSIYQVSTGQISKEEFALDMIMTGVGFLGPAGTVVSLLYFGGKALYEYQSENK